MKRNITALLLLATVGLFARSPGDIVYQVLGSNSAVDTSYISAAQFRTNIGASIGTDVQAHDASLDLLSGAAPEMRLLNISGSPYSGYIQLGIVASAPAAAAAPRLYSTSGDLSWKVVVDSWSRSFAGTLTADRTYTWPDASGNVPLLQAAQTWTAAQTNSTAGAANTPAYKFSGALFTGGSATTTKPLLLIEPAGTASTGWVVTGTALGINLPTGTGGNAIDVQINSVRKFSVSATGLITGASLSAPVVGSSSTLTLQSYGASIASLDAGGSGFLSLYPLQVSDSQYIGFYNGGTGQSTVKLYKASDGVLDVRDGTNAQELRVFNTYTSTTSWEAALVDWKTTAGSLRIGSDKGSGGGTARDVKFIRGGTVKVTLGANTNDDAQPRKLPSYTVASLPSAATCGAGSFAFVTDASNATGGATVVGGGATKLLVFSNGTNWLISGGTSSGGGGSVTQWLIKSGAYTAVAGDKIQADTSTNGAFTITLPAAPSAGDVVEVEDAKLTWDTVAVTIGRNGLKINGATTDVVGNAHGGMIRAVYIDSSFGWSVKGY